MRLAFISVHGCPIARLGEKDTGGMNVFLRETALELGRRGCTVDIYTRRHDPDDPQVVSLSENARVIHLEAGPLDEGKLSLYQRLPEFSRRLEAYMEVNGLQYDLVHSHYWLSGPVALGLRERLGIPVVSSLHTLGEVQRLVTAGATDARQRIPTERQVIREADVVVAASPQEREEMLRLYAADPDRTSVIPCGFDESIFRPLDRSAARAELGLTGPKVVLFAGRMERIKGIDVLLRAVAALDGLDLQIVIIGGGADDAGLARVYLTAEQLGIRDRLHCVGTVPHHRMPLYYSATDVCVVPSLYETFGLVALEAMACGTPVIAARVGGLQATVTDGKNGYLIPWHCPEPYAERMEIVLENDLLRESLGKAAQASVKHLTWSTVGDRLISLYEKALGQFTSAGNPAHT